MTPEPFRGKINQPAYIPYIVKKVAEIKGLTIENVLQITNENSLYMFQEPLKNVV